MEMDIAALANGKIEYRCRTMKTESREAIPLHSGNAETGESLLRMCSCCKKAYAGNATWLEIEDAISLPGLFSQETVLPITHTICDACANKLTDAD